MLKTLGHVGIVATGATTSNYLVRGIDKVWGQYVSKTPYISNDAVHLSKAVTNAIKNVHIPSPVSFQRLVGLGVGLVGLKVTLEKWLANAKKDVA
jgi:hypothetical protein